MDGNSESCIIDQVVESLPSWLSHHAQLSIFNIRRKMQKTGKTGRGIRFYDETEVSNVQIGVPI